MKNKYTLLFFFISFLCIGLTEVKAQPMSGTYTIGGTNPDFMTITQAWEKLKRVGNSADVIFNVRPGVYNESLDIDCYRDLYIRNVPNSGELRIVGNNVTITSTNPVATLRLNMMDIRYPFGEGFTIINTSATGAALMVGMDSDSRIIEKVTVKSNGGAGIHLGYPVDRSSIMEMSIKDCTIEGGKYGIYSAATEMTTIYRNYISGFSVAGIYTVPYDEWSGSHQISYNYIYNSSGTPVSGECYGIYSADGGSDIRHNEVTLHSNVSANGTYGIYTHGGMLYGNDIFVWGGNGIYGGSAFTNNTILASGGKGIFTNSSATLINNEVVSYADDCIQIAGGTVTNNSTYLYNSSKGSAFKSTGSVSLVNNSFYNASTNSSTSAIDVVALTSSNYNNLYSDSPVLGIYNSRLLTTINFWKAVTGKDANSISADPLYSDPELGSMQINLSSPLVGRALASSMPGYDITGNPRQYNAIGANDPYPRTGWYRTAESELFPSLSDDSGREPGILFEENSRITLTYPVSEEAAAFVTVYNALTNQPVERLQVVFTPEDSYRTIDISLLPAGYYIIKMVAPKGMISEKIYKK